MLRDEGSPFAAGCCDSPWKCGEAEQNMEERKVCSTAYTIRLWKSFPLGVTVTTSLAKLKQ